MENIIENNYKYLPLRDAMISPNMKVNLLAVVVESGVPKKSKGTDYVCTLKIMDASHKDPGLSVNFFAEDMGKLPHVKSSGDIISLHHVMIKIHNGDVNAVFNKKYSSFALFGAEPSDDVNPYQISSKFKLTDNDKELITRLRTWLLDHQFDAGANAYLLQVREINAGRYFDLVCKILHVCEVPEHDWILFVWDGTDASPASFETSLDDEAQNPLPLQLEHSPLSRDVLSTFPRVGTVLRIFAGKFFEELGLKSLGIGQWVKFRNVVCQLRSGLWHGLLTSSCRLRTLSDEDTIVIQRQRFYSDRLTSGLDILPLSSFPWPSRTTETDYEGMTFSTLIDVLTHSKVTAIFKCVVRVVAIYPWRVDDFRSPVGTCVYRIRLTLEDPTARIHAYVYGDDGETFFNGYPPADVLNTKINKLLGITESNSSEDECNAPRNPPWVQCCIKSYYLDKSNPWETRRYKIFGTKLIG